MHQEPCGSETTTSGYSCASDGRLVWTSDSAEQAVNTPNDDEEMLEQMSHPKNKVMERMTPLERWNGLAWVCMEWLWKGLARCGGEGSSGTTVFPQTQRVRLVRLTLCGCDLTTSISSPRTSYGNKGESAQTDDLPRQPSKKYSTEADVSHHVRHVLEDSSGDGYRRPGEWMLSPKKVTKEANQQDVSW